MEAQARAQTAALGRGRVQWDGRRWADGGAGRVDKWVVDAGVLAGCAGGVRWLRGTGGVQGIKEVGE